MATVGVKGLSSITVSSIDAHTGDTTFKHSLGLTHLHVLKLSAYDTESVVDRMVVDADFWDTRRQATWQPFLLNVTVHHHRRLRTHHWMLTVHTQHMMKTIESLSVAFHTWLNRAIQLKTCLHPQNTAGLPQLTNNWLSVTAVYTTCDWFTYKNVCVTSARTSRQKWHQSLQLYILYKSNQVEIFVNDSWAYSVMKVEISDWISSRQTRRRQFSLGWATVALSAFSKVYFISAV